ncbi:MAG: hypothetical protein IKF16_04715 [Lachnospiraceae bacterium]|nr:hypothetical protein [Lachnospiraceae bacterium]
MYYNNRRLALSVFWIILGAVLFILSVMEKLDSSMYAGMGGALMGVGILQVIRIFRYRKDAGYREKIDTEIHDERVRYIHMKSWAWTGYIVVLAEAVGVIAATVLGQDLIRSVLAYSVCLIMVVYWITYMVLSRKY